MLITKGKYKTNEAFILFIYIQFILLISVYDL